MLGGDLGRSVIYKRPVNEIFWDRLGNTGILAGVTFVIMVPDRAHPRRAGGA